MARYTVGITGRIYVISEFDVEADNPQEAELKALRLANKSDHEPWLHYTSVPDGETLQVEDVTLIEPVNVYARREQRSA